MRVATGLLANSAVYHSLYILVVSIYLHEHGLLDHAPANHDQALVNAQEAQEQARQYLCIALAALPHPAMDGMYCFQLASAGKRHELPSDFTNNLAFQ